MTSYLSVLARNSPQGPPLCWDWDHQTILDYIEERVALAKSNKDTLLPDILAVYQQILKPCIKGKTYYITLLDGARNETVNVAHVIVRFHHHKVPITNVFDALGWFISVTELRRGHGTSEDLISEHFERFVNFTRLCHKLKKFMKDNVGQVPAKAHMLFSANLPSVFASGDIWEEIGALSTSLPSMTKNAGKEMSTAIRQGSFSYNRTPQVSQANFRGAKDCPWKLGHCAETLTILSQIQSTQWMYVLGAALKINKLSGPFKGYDYYRNGPAHDPACGNCRILFSRCNATLIDICSQQILGPVPTGLQIDSRWTQLKFCHTCGDFMNTKDRRKKSSACRYGCAAVWCNNCRQSDDTAHEESCLLRHLLRGTLIAPETAQMSFPSAVPFVPGQYLYPAQSSSAPQNNCPPSMYQMSGIPAQGYSEAQDELYRWGTSPSTQYYMGQY
ncbi:hypothetical protein SCHPADRAFT_261420 [Schizopora paradoxa]|uniref:Uncharacterized protein n=1 Tax=Schizopora paradoxa TaxID=27342 RepID=A0A0H2RU73_9AGAM|nr:hypothetical protein SCHPADRAFT_261420 [Schizopora paradoxa]